VRFDAVYYGHFKCNLRRLADYAALSRFVRDIYNLPKVALTVNFEHIKRHYYESHTTINPTGVVPLGPVIDFAVPARHGDHSSQSIRAGLPQMTANLTRFSANVDV
jgi:putative glutathione S-transferase